jgi:hypothetical protein
MARVADLISWATAEAGLRTHLAVPAPAEATTLQLLLESAVEACDAYLGNQPGWITLPRKIELGIYEWCRVMRAANAAGGVLKRVKTHELEEEYADAGVRSAARSIELDYWYDRKAQPWLV